VVLIVRPNWLTAMLRIITSKYDIFSMLASKQRPPYEQVWHVWSIIIPRRSITGRLLWGTVLRRRHDGRWIYKNLFEGGDPTKYRKSARTLFMESKKR
jgi:hypothetical protein